MKEGDHTSMLFHPHKINCPDCGRRLDYMDSAVYECHNQRCDVIWMKVTEVFVNRYFAFVHRSGMAKKRSTKETEEIWR